MRVPIQLRQVTMSELAGLPLDQRIHVLEQQQTNTLKLIREHYVGDRRESWAKVYPRNIAPPGGFPSPQSIAAQMMVAIDSAVCGSTEVLAKDIPLQSQFATCSKLIEYRMPTFFISRPLLEALLVSEPPEDYAFGDLHWPMPAMLFVFPERRIESPSDGWLTCMGVARLSPGQFSNPFSNDMLLGQTMEGLRLGHEGFSYFAPASTGIVFGSIHAAKADTAIRDITGTKDPDFARVYVRDAEATELSAVDNNFLGMLGSLAMRLLLLLNARPDFIGTSRQIRKASTNPKKPSTDLWSANILGENYKLRTDASASHPAGTHASPRLHFRRGHMRNQRHGPNRALSKLIWIEPMLIGA